MVSIAKETTGREVGNIWQSPCTVYVVYCVRGDVSLEIPIGEGEGRRGVIFSVEVFRNYVGSEDDI